MRLTGDKGARDARGRDYEPLEATEAGPPHGLRGAGERSRDRPLNGRLEQGAFVNFTVTETPYRSICTASLFNNGALRGRRCRDDFWVRMGFGWTKAATASEAVSGDLIFCTTMPFLSTVDRR